MKLIKFIFLSISFSVFFIQCDKKKDERVEVQNRNFKNKNTITSISFSTVGGMLGYSRLIDVNRDSVHVFIGLAADQKSRDSSFVNTKENWGKIIQLANLEHLSEVKNGQSNQPVDGTDDILHVAMAKDTITIVNGYTDSLNYKKIEPLVEYINTLFPSKIDEI